MKNLNIFPDIRLICDDIPQTEHTGILEISCCIRGVCEYNINNVYHYLTDGNCLILKHENECHISHSVNCRVVTVLVDTKNTLTSISKLADINRFLDLKENNLLIFQDKKVTDVFSEVYECTNNSVLKIKVLQLLMLLNEHKVKFHSKDRKVIRAGKFICNHLSEHYTISQLSEMFSVDCTTLKSIFKQVYGCPVYTYTKNRRIFHASELLKTTQMKVIDIAGEIGYSNASKFSSAFRDVMGVNPKCYQKEHKSAF